MLDLWMMIQSGLVKLIDALGSDGLSQIFFSVHQDTLSSIILSPCIFAPLLRGITPLQESL